jgi:hypothetical protein
MSIEKFWKNYGFEIILVSLVIFFILGFFFNRRKEKQTFTEILKTTIPINNEENFPNYNNNTQEITTTRKRTTESKGELECKNVLESIFNKPFNKSRPNFLKNVISGNNLELDCFNEELGIACEYNGRQHYEFVPYFHRNKETFQNQQYRDHMKRDLCRKNNIILIEVPYTIKIKDIRKYILKELNQR